MIDGPAGVVEDRGTGNYLTGAQRQAVGAVHRDAPRPAPLHLSSEIGRHGGSDDYRAVEAQARCDALRARPKPRRLAASARLYNAANEGLAQHWSPRQISRRLRVDYPDDEGMQVSHETVYECRYLQARGQLRTQLKLALGTGRTGRVNRSRPAVVRGRFRTWWPSASVRPRPTTAPCPGSGRAI